MRLFTAIDIPDQAKQQLQQLQDPNLGVNWTSPERMHITLRFIGDVEETEKRQQLIAAFQSINKPAFRMTIKGLGYFSPQKHPKIIWTGIDDNPRLMELQERIEQACRSAGLDPETRSYTPHITIGRVQSISKKETYAFFNQNKRVRIDDIPVEEFILYESKLHPDGAVHSPLKRFGLYHQQTENEA